MKNKQSHYQETKEDGDKPLRVDTADDNMDSNPRKSKFQNPVEMIQNRLENMSPLALDDNY